MFRESLFLFRRKDGVYNTLSKINDACIGVINYERYVKDREIKRYAKADNIDVRRYVKDHDIKTLTEDEKQRLSMLMDRATTARESMEPLLKDLEWQLRRYLDFRRLK